VQRVTQLAQITNPVVVAHSLFKIKNHILLHRYFMYISYLGYKDGVGVQQLKSNVLAVDATLSQAPSAKDLPVPGRSAVACSEPNISYLPKRALPSEQILDRRRRRTKVSLALNSCFEAVS